MDNPAIPDDQLARFASRIAANPNSLAALLAGIDDKELLTRLSISRRTLARLKICGLPDPDGFQADVESIAAALGIAPAALADAILDASGAPARYWLTTSQAAAQLGRSTARVAQLAAAGELRAARSGAKLLRIDPRSVAQYAAIEHKSGPKRQPKPAKEPKPPREKKPKPPSLAANRGKHGQLPKRGGTSSVYKGVTAATTKGRGSVWRAQIRYRAEDSAEVLEHLGCFDSEVEAAEAYDKAALRVYGENARTNF